jgi:hypothetical protein
MSACGLEIVRDDEACHARMRRPDELNTLSLG